MTAEPAAPSGPLGDPTALRMRRLGRYEDATSTVMVSLALAYMFIYAAEVLAPGLPGWAGVAIGLSGNAIWAVFVLDLLIRVTLAPNRFQYLLRHPIEVLAVLLPMFRFLRVLRVITAGQWLVSRGKRLIVGRTAAAILVAVTFLVVVGGLAVLDAERGAPGSPISNFGDAVWWAFTTMSTVGYGDMYPVTLGGRLVAVGMMTVGVSLLGVVSGTMATGFLARTRAEDEVDNAALLHQIGRLETRVTELTTLLAGNRGPAGEDSPDGDRSPSDSAGPPGSS